ncbi:hypothetical protein XI05_18720 [Bradyrhizobium sp. CCBAU 11357]|nr:hypothetical protein [Bradyrhizobium sp. CCBAU 11357]
MRLRCANSISIFFRSAYTTVERRKLLPDLFKVDKSIDRPEQVVGRDMPFERELIEQRSLFDLPMSHHDLQSCQLDRLSSDVLD